MLVVADEVVVRVHVVAAILVAVGSMLMSTVTTPAGILGFGSLIFNRYKARFAELV